VPDQQIDVEAYLEALAGGNSAALARLFEHFRPRLLQVVSLYMNPKLRTRAEAADVLQEAYVDAAEQIHAYLSRREVNFYVWLRGIAMQRLSKFHRFHLQTQRRSVSRQIVLPDASSMLLGRQLVARGSSPSQHLRKDELRDQVQRAVDSLAECDREIILMRHFEGLSNGEVAQSLGLSASASTMRYGRALVRLRAAMLTCGAMGESSA
jgi:RNA polymerase sigma-70 factor (ECF subfamily)